jgi:hypothetical protein
VIDRPIFLGAAKSGFNAPSGARAKTLANGILSLSSPLTVEPLPVIGRCHFRPVTDRLLNGRLPGSDQVHAPLGNPIAFFTALQIISCEKGLAI